MPFRNPFRNVGRAVLSDEEILKYNSRNLLIEGEITEHQLQPNSVDLRLADTVKVLKYNADAKNIRLGFRGSKYIDTSLPIEYEEREFSDYDLRDPDKPAAHKWYIINPKEFCLMASKEILNIPNGILSFVQGRSSVARLAIQTEQAGLIDAGFRGTITFEVFNQSNYPIVLYEGMRIAQVYFFKAQYATKVYGSKSKGSKYYDQIEATGSRINNDPELK